jgi:hypothetical protein
MSPLESMRLMHKNMTEANSLPYKDHHPDADELTDRMWNDPECTDADKRKLVEILSYCLFDPDTIAHTFL